MIHGQRSLFGASNMRILSLSSILAGMMFPAGFNPVEWDSQGCDADDCCISVCRTICTRTQQCALPRSGGNQSNCSSVVLRYG